MTSASGDELTVEGPRFAMVPEWVIDADIGDCAFRLYAVLLRYGNTSGTRMPSRSTLARRLHKRSVDTVDRAMRELVALGAVRVERRTREGVQLTNRYHVRTTAPSASSGGGTRAATGRTVAAPTSRTDAAEVAADVRPDPESFTESTSPRPEDLADECRRLRRSLGLPAARWSVCAVERALDRAEERGYERSTAAAALLHVAADPGTISPLRVAEPGPWWTTTPLPDEPAADLDLLEQELDAVDGGRVALQRRARDRLRARGLPLTRATVVREAATILRDSRP